MKHLAVLMRLELYLSYELSFLRYPIYYITNTFYETKIIFAAASYSIHNILPEIYPNQMSLSLSFAMGI